MEDTNKLTELRKEIDTIDLELLTLLNKRAKLALQVRIAKGGTTVYRPEREAEVLQQVAAKNKGPLSAEAVKTMFQSIIYVCRSIQEVKIKKGS
jgi:chorismate mutase/prephenate dehydratase